MISWGPGLGAGFWLRNSVEHTINKIKDWRGLATRYDKSPKATRQDSNYAPASSASDTSTHSIDHNSTQALADAHATLGPLPPLVTQRIDLP